MMHAAAVDPVPSHGGWGSLTTSCKRGMEGKRATPRAVVSFLARGRLCTGPLCLSSNPKGLTRVPEMFSQGHAVCDLCANGLSAAELAALDQAAAELKAKAEGAHALRVLEAQCEEQRAGSEDDKETRGQGDEITPSPCPPVSPSSSLPSLPSVPSVSTPHDKNLPASATAQKPRASGPRVSGRKPSPRRKAVRESARRKPRPSGVAQSARDDSAGILDFSHAAGAVVSLQGKSGWRSVQVMHKGTVLCATPTRGTTARALADARMLMVALYHFLTEAEAK